MRRVERNEIVDYQTYGETREAFRRQVLAEKSRRRIHAGECFTFLFENPMTVRYQIQEMMRAEKIVREKDILHELETYNQLLGGSGELGCTLLIEIDDPAQRDQKLRQWLDLPEHICVVMADGSKVRPKVDAAQRDSDRISSVQYLKFAVQGKVPVAIVSDYPGIEAQTQLTDEHRAALAEDLAS